MGVDEVGTLRALKTIRRELTDPAIASHRGRIVKTSGDGILIEFPSVVDAVACAVAIQEGMMVRNAGAPEDKRIVFRIGINIGDIIIDEADIHGDGVNVAVRLEALSDPGGICLSDDAYRQVRGKIEAAFSDMGEQALKNIAQVSAGQSVGVVPTTIVIARCAPSDSLFVIARNSSFQFREKAIDVRCVGARAWRPIRHRPSLRY
jgi:adenylate cyclase